MDQALSRELESFKKRKTTNLQNTGGDELESKSSNVNNSRKRKAGGTNTRNKASTTSASSLNKTSLPPQIINSLKKIQNKMKANAPIPLKGSSSNNKYYCSNKTKSGILACVVDFLKDKFFGEMEKVHENKIKMEECEIAFALETILDQTQNLNTSLGDKEWLIKTALPNNPKVKVVGNKFQYKPAYDVSDRKSLLKLLESHNDNGYGGILIDDVRDSAFNADNTILALRNRIFHLSRINDKKDVIFYYDPQYVMGVDEELVSMWKGVNVEGVDERGIEKYLSMANISCFPATTAPITARSNKEEKKKSNRGRQAKVLNIHLADGVLRDYNF